jgi:hypothetical protein
MCQEPQRLEMVPREYPVPGQYRFVFIAGLHRSGTTIVHRCVRGHPQISGFKDTGVPEDEGQHLQSVFPPAHRFGGLGRFGFNPQAHLTEESPIACLENVARLWSEWSRYWDLSKEVLVEKSPANLLRLRYLQKCFPNSHFLVLVRHPVATAYATNSYTRKRWRKWLTVDVREALRHWFHCHEVFLADRPHIKNLTIVRYEDFASRPDLILNMFYKEIQVPPLPLVTAVHAGSNVKYFTKWNRDLQSGRLGADFRRLADRYENAAARFGYSMLQLEP